MMYGLGFGMGWTGVIIMFVLWGSLIFGGMWVVSRFFPNKHSIDKADNQNLTALEILNKRYARGEVSSEEYNQIKEDLTK